jgi:hypothetical protein
VERDYPTLHYRQGVREQVQGQISRAGLSEAHGFVELEGRLLETL